MKITCQYHRCRQTVVATASFYLIYILLLCLLLVCVLSMWTRFRKSYIFYTYPNVVFMWTLHSLNVEPFSMFEHATNFCSTYMYFLIPFFEAFSCLLKQSLCTIEVSFKTPMRRMLTGSSITSYQSSQYLNWYFRHSKKFQQFT